MKWFSWCLTLDVDFPFSFRQWQHSEVCSPGREGWWRGDVLFPGNDGVVKSVLKVTDSLVNSLHSQSSCSTQVCQLQSQRMTFPSTCLVLATTCTEQICNPSLKEGRWRVKEETDVLYSGSLPLEKKQQMWVGILPFLPCAARLNLGLFCFLSPWAHYQRY